MEWHCTTNVLLSAHCSQSVMTQVNCLSKPMRIKFYELPFFILHKPYYKLPETNFFPVLILKPSYSRTICFSSNKITIFWIFFWHLLHIQIIFQVSILNSLLWNVTHAQESAKHKWIITKPISNHHNYSTQRNLWTPPNPVEVTVFLNFS